MTIIIPIVGQYEDTDEMYIRGLQEINRETVLQHVYNSLKELKDAQVIFIVRREDVKRFHIDNTIKLMVPNAKVVIAEGKTAGSACTCLLAVDLLDMNDSLVITGSNQIITTSVQKAVDYFEENNFDGGLITFDDIHPRWSFVKLDENRQVIEAAEKRPISRHAATGFYYFKKTQDFIESAKEMIKKNASVNGNYYVCPAYNEMILKQKLIGIYEINKWQYFNLASNQGVKEYEKYLSEVK